MDEPVSDRPAEQDLPELLVLGRPHRDLLEFPLLESPGLETATSVVDQESIQEQNAYSVIEALRFVPGAWVESRGRKVKQFFSVRGQKYPYPEYALNGAWQREFHEMPYLLSAANFERIEILRSGSAMLTGPGSTVGLINLVPRTYTNMETTVAASYGFYNMTQLNLNHGSPLGESFSYALGFGNRSTEGPRGENAAENLSDFFGRIAGKPLERLTLSLDLFGVYGKRELESGEPPATQRFQDDLSRYDPYQAFLAVGKAQLEESDWATLDVTLNYSYRDHDFILASVSDPLGTKIDEEDYEYGANVIQALQFLPGNTLRVGGLYNRWVAPNGKRFYVGRRSELETFSWVIVDEQKLGPFQLNAGYRWSRTYIDEFGGFNINGSGGAFRGVPPVTDEWEPPAHRASAGAAYYLSERWSLHLNLTGGQVEPRPGALTEDFEKPERELRYNIDLGLKHTSELLGELALTGFFTRQEDAIALTGQTLDVDGIVTELYENRDQDQVGVEFDVRSLPWELGYDSNLRLFFNVVALTARKKVDGDWEHNEEIPRTILSSGILLDRGGVDASVYLRYVSGYENSRFVPASLGPQPLGDFVSLNARLGYGFGERRQYRVFIAAENLLDDEYSTVAGYPDWGFRGSAGIHFTF